MLASPTHLVSEQLLLACLTDSVDTMKRYPKFNMTDNLDSGSKPQPKCMCAARYPPQWDRTLCNASANEECKKLKAVSRNAAKN